MMFLVLEKASSHEMICYVFMCYFEDVIIYLSNPKVGVFIEILLDYDFLGNDNRSLNQ